MAPVPFEMLNSDFDPSHPENHHYLDDTFWTPLDVQGAMSTIGGLISEAPSGKSFVLAVMPGHGAAGQGLPDKGAAYSMDERTVILTYAIWKDAADDQSNRRWMKDDLTRVFDPHGTFHGFPGTGSDKPPSS